MSDFLDLKLHSLDVPTGSDDWYTPSWIFEALKVSFDLDVCSPPEGIKWLPAKRYYSLLDDGLLQDWEGFIWMNPPYSNPLPWVRKFIQHGEGIALVPTSTGKWMMELWEANTSWIVLEPMRFQAANGQLAKGALPTRCWLVAVGDRANEAMHSSGLGRVR